MAQSKKLSRRRFIRQGTKVAAAGVAAPYVIRSGVLAAPGKPGPNDRVVVGYIGAGGRARLLMDQMPPGAQIVAAADCYVKRAQEAAQQKLPFEGTVLITVSEDDRPAVLDLANQFNTLGFNIKATRGTHQFLAENGIQSELILKMHQGRPNIADSIKNNEIQLVINTPSGKLSQHDDSYIRKAAIQYKVPYITTLAAGIAAARGIAAIREKQVEVRSLQSYHEGIK